MDLVGTLQVLVRVVETGSFSAVARERDLTQAAVARQISQLEAHFGVRLFHCTTRKLSLTDDGQMLLVSRGRSLTAWRDWKPLLGARAPQRSDWFAWESR